MGFYLEDQWRATDKLTVTLGARYERSFVQQPSLVNPDWPQTGQIHDGPLDLMPRLGLAYKLNDKTVVRAGYGTFYARFIGGLGRQYFHRPGSLSDFGFAEQHEQSSVGCRPRVSERARGASHRSQLWPPPVFNSLRRI